jgi:uncharacterized coiled-coil protein SlyX
MSQEKMSQEKMSQEKMSQDEISRRLEDLEIRSAYQEDLVAKLDQVIQTQANRIDRLVMEMEKLQEQSAQSGEPEAPMEEQVPPHY